VNLHGNTAIKNMEVLLITDDAQAGGVAGPTHGTSLILQASDVLNFTDSNHKLTIDGSAGDEVHIGTIGAGGWTDAGINGNFHTYTQTVSGSVVTLNVETSVVVVGDLAST